MFTHTNPSALLKPAAVRVDSAPPKMALLVADEKLLVALALRFSDMEPDALLSLLRSADDSVFTPPDITVSVVDVAVAALRVHYDHADVQQMALELLMFSATGADGEKSRMRAGSLGAIPAALAALRLHAHNEWVQAVGFAALANVIGNVAAYREQAAAAGAVEAAIAASRNHGAFPLVQAACFSTIIRVTCDSAESTRTAIAAGAIADAVTTMRLYPMAVQVQRACCGCLGNIRTSAAFEAGGAEAILTAMSAYRSDVEVQDNGCSALSSLYDDARFVAANNHAKSLRDHAIDAVMYAMKTHSADADTQRNGCRALQSLAQSAEGKAKATQAHWGPC